MVRSAKLLAMLYATVIMATMGFGALRLGVGHKVGVLHGSVWLAGLATATFFAGRGLASTLSSIVYDRAPGVARRLPPASLAGVAATAYAIGITRDPYIVAALTGVQGVLSGMVWPYVQTLVALSSGGSSLWVSVYFALGSLGISVGRLLYPHLLAHSLQTVFTYSAVMYAAASTALAATLASSEHARVRGAVKHVVGRRSTRGAALPVAVNFSTGFLSGLDSQVLYAVLVLDKEVNVVDAAYAFSLAGVASIPSKVLFGGLASATSIRAALAVGVACATAALAGLWVSSGFAALASAAAYLAVVASLTPLARTYAARVGERMGMPATIVGLSNTASNIGSVVAPLAVNALITIPIGFLAYIAPAAASTLAMKSEDS